MATAATPKRSFKRTVASTVEGRTPRFLLGSLALAMVISLLAGLGIGVKIGEHGKTTTKKPAGVAKPTPTTRKRPVVAKSPFAKPPLKGTVGKVTPKLMALVRGKARIPLVLVLNTKIEATEKASAAEIKPGAHVQFVLGPNTATTPTSAATPTSGTGTPTTGAAKPAFAAKSVLIISGASAARMGSIVASVTHDSMTFKSPNGTAVTISTVGAHVTKTIPATRAFLKTGQHVLVKTYLPPAPKKPKKAAKAPKAKGKKARVVKRTRVALEVVILPDNSAFA